MYDFYEYISNYIKRAKQYLLQYTTQEIDCSKGTNGINFRSNKTGKYSAEKASFIFDELEKDARILITEGDPRLQNLGITLEKFLMKNYTNRSDYCGELARTTPNTNQPPIQTPTPNTGVKKYWSRKKKKKTDITETEVQREVNKIYNELKIKQIMNRIRALNEVQMKVEKS